MHVSYLLYNRCAPGFIGLAGQGYCKTKCPAGYYCHVLNVPTRALPCGGSDAYCPLGSSKPTKVSPGYYTTPEASSPTLRTGQSICPLGYYCVNGIKNACPPGRYGRETGLSSDKCSGLCNRGYFCPLASVSATQSVCPKGNMA